MSHSSSTKYGILLLATLSITFLSYFYFASYKPKVLKQLEEVKGAASTDAQFTFVYPDGSKELGYSQNGNSMQLTYEASRSMASIHLFYRNIFDVKGWRRKSSTTGEGVEISRYKLDNVTVSVTTSVIEGSDKILVSLESSGK